MNFWSQGGGGYAEFTNTVGSSKAYTTDPRIKPGAPSITSVTNVTNSTADVAWSASAYPSTYVGVSYSVTSSPATTTQITTGTSITFPNLIPSTSYTFTVTGTNIYGSTSSAPSGSYTTGALDTTSLLLSVTNPFVIAVNSYNNYIYYIVTGTTQSIYVTTLAGAAVTTITSLYNIKSGPIIDSATGTVYFTYLNGTQYGVGVIDKDTYAITYNNISTIGNGQGCFSGGFLYVYGTLTVYKIDTSSWAVSTYVTYTSGTNVIQGITATSAGDIYIMRVSNFMYKNQSTTGLFATGDYWGLTTDNVNLYMGGAGLRGVWRNTPPSVSQGQIITGGTYNPPQLMTSLFYYKGAIYIAGLLDNAIILLN